MGMFVSQWCTSKKQSACACACACAYAWAFARVCVCVYTSAEMYMFVGMGAPHDDDFDVLQRVTGTAPQNVNTYSDGSVGYPSHRFAAMGTYAVYHKHPCISQHDITSDETLATTFCREINGTLQLHSLLPGAVTSSNCAEAAALLLALMRPVPPNIGIDNALAVSTANRTIHGLQPKHRKPRELQPNGDIWPKIEKILDERGHGTTKVAKLKGHATQQHVEDKVITAEG